MSAPSQPPKDEAEAVIEVKASPGSQIVGGIGWTALMTIVRLGSVTAAMAILSRLVSPSLMGAFGTAWIAVNLGNSLSQAGAAQALVQLRSMTNGHVGAAFLASVTITTVLSGALLAATPIAARFYANPLVIDAFKMAAVFLLISSLGVVETAVLQRTLQFRRVALFRSVGSLFSALIAIGMALAGFKLAALFAADGLTGLVLFLCFRLSKAPLPIHRFHWRDVAELWRSGLQISAGTVMGTIAQAAPIFLIGRFLTSADVGYFTFCQRIVQILGAQLGLIINNVLYPVLSHHQSNKRDMSDTFLQTTRYSLFALLLPLSILVAAPSECLALFGGKQWTPAENVLRFLALAQISYSAGTNVFTAFQAYGRFGVAWRWNCVIGALAAISVYAGHVAGIDGVAGCIALSSLVNFAAIAWLGKVLDFTLKRFLETTWPAFLASALSVASSYAALYVLRDEGLMIRTLAASAICGLVFFSTCLLLDRTMTQYLFAQLSRIGARRRSDMRRRT